VESKRGLKRMRCRSFSRFKVCGEMFYGILPLLAIGNNDIVSHALITHKLLMLIRNNIVG